MARLTIDSRTVEAVEGSSILDAARALGIDIPTLCYFKGLPPNTSCMVCVVKVNGGEALVPACATKVEEGMVVESNTDEVRSFRRTALELLLGEHAGIDPLSGPGQDMRCRCAQPDTCKLRRYYIEYGGDHRTHPVRRREVVADKSHPDIIYEPGKCISCGLCIQVCEAGSEAIGLALNGRGFDTRVRPPWEETLAASLSQAAALRCLKVCPTHAITRKRIRKEGPEE
jgi:NADH dehydrogenase/NADH:ubiquinone oxidoreductase subunit G